MQQRQPRLGDILDDYCPRERRLTNHVVVAMVGDDVKQTRCTTCDADHAYKQAKIPRHRSKAETAVLPPMATGAPKRVVHEPMNAPDALQVPALASAEPAEQSTGGTLDDGDGGGGGQPSEEGPVHRTLIRAQLPRIDGQPPPSRPAPDFTIRQPAGRQNRFTPRHQRGGAAFQGQGSRQPGSGNGGNGNVAGGPRGGAPRQAGGRPPMASRLARRQSPGGKRSK